MTLLEKLGHRWELDKAGQAKLRKLLDSPSGETLVALLREIPQPLSPPIAQPGIDHREIQANLYQQLVGWNRCLQTLEDLSQGLPEPPVEPQPFDHYGSESPA